ncbi:MAG: hypothetical protein V7709_19880 [Halioglobus sp.]
MSAHLSLLVLGATGALALIWAGAEGNLSALQFGNGELVFAIGRTGSAFYPVLSKLGLERGWLSHSATLRNPLSV